jgi:hypothetical protein
MGWDLCSRAPGFLDQVQRPFWIGGHLDKAAVFRLNHSLRHSVVEESEQAVVEAAAIHTQVYQDTGLGVDLQLRPGHNLDELVERSKPAGQCDKRIGPRSEQRFALVHGPNHMEFSQSFVIDFSLSNHIRNDTDYFATGGQGTVGNRAHRADRRSAVDQAMASSSNEAAQFGGRIEIDRRSAGSRGAENTNPLLFRNTRSHLCEFSAALVRLAGHDGAGDAIELRLRHYTLADQIVRR